MRKRILVAVVSLAALSLAACGGGGGGEYIPYNPPDSNGQNGNSGDIVTSAEFSNSLGTLRIGMKNLSYCTHLTIEACDLGADYDGWVIGSATLALYSPGGDFIRNQELSFEAYCYAGSGAVGGNILAVDEQVGGFRALKWSLSSE